MYADKITPSMARAIDETDRRRAKQTRYNVANGIDPQPLRKKIHDILDDIYREAEDTALRRRHGRAAACRPNSSRGKAPGPETASRAAPAGDVARPRAWRAAELAHLIQDLNDQMLAAARELQFELAAPHPRRDRPS